MTAPSLLDASLNNLYWIIAAFQIFFFGLLLLTVLQGTTHRHPATFAFFLASWAASWIALLPYLGRVWDHVKSLSPNLSNVDPSTNAFKICQANAIALKYLWTVIPGILSVFSGEILRVLLRCRFGGPKPKPSIKTQQTRTEVNFLDCNNPLVCIESIDHRPHERFSYLKNLLRHSFPWQIILVLIPFISSLPAPILTSMSFASTGWKTVHVNLLACSAIGNDVGAKLTLLIMWHLVPCSILSLTSLVTYISLCRQSAAKANSYFHFGLTLRLGALSILSGVGGVACMVAAFNIGKLREQKPILEICMITFPLLASLFFIDDSIVEIWRSWLHPKNSATDPSEVEPTDKYRFARSSILRIFEDDVEINPQPGRPPQPESDSPSRTTQDTLVLNAQIPPSNIKRGYPHSSFSSIYAAYQSDLPTPPLPPSSAQKKLLVQNS